jgi:hypothetical protein
VSILQVKKEEEPPQEPVLAKTPVFRAPVPRMHLWPTQTNPGSALRSDWEPSAYETPATRRQIPGFTCHETPLGDQLDPK